jgi:hypothetical protein
LEGEFASARSSADGRFKTLHELCDDVAKRASLSEANIAHVATDVSKMAHVAAVVEAMRASSAREFEALSVRTRELDAKVVDVCGGMDVQRGRLDAREKELSDTLATLRTDFYEGVERRVAAAVGEVGRARVEAAESIAALDERLSADRNRLALVSEAVEKMEHALRARLDDVATNLEAHRKASGASADKLDEAIAAVKVAAEAALSEESKRLEGKIEDTRIAGESSAEAERLRMAAEVRRLDLAFDAAQRRADGLDEALKGLALADDALESLVSRVTSSLAAEGRERTRAIDSAMAAERELARSELEAVDSRLTVALAGEALFAGAQNEVVRDSVAAVAVAVVEIESALRGDVKSLTEKINIAERSAEGAADQTLRAVALLSQRTEELSKRIDDMGTAGADAMRSQLAALSAQIEALQTAMHSESLSREQALAVATTSLQKEVSDRVAAAQDLVRALEEEFEFEKVISRGSLDSVHNLVVESLQEVRKALIVVSEGDANTRGIAFECKANFEEFRGFFETWRGAVDLGVASLDAKVSDGEQLRSRGFESAKAAM